MTYNTDLYTWLVNESIKSPTYLTSFSSSPVPKFINYKLKKKLKDGSIVYVQLYIINYFLLDVTSPSSISTGVYCGCGVEKVGVYSLAGTFDFILVNNSEPDFVKFSRVSLKDGSFSGNIM